MDIKKFFKEIARLQLSALIFYSTLLLLWSLGVIPAPIEIMAFLETLYQSYGLMGLFVASFLEGIVYLSLYFPGSFVVALAVFLSDGTLNVLISISVIVATALTITSIINYIIGRHVVLKKTEEKSLPKEYKMASKGLFFSMLHPSSLGFYFFHAGIEKHNPWKIIFVPLVMIPYGLTLAYVLYHFKGPLQKSLESPYLMITVIFVWFVMAFVFEHRKKRKNLALIDISE